MGFALPAAIAASLTEPERRVVAFTGDGGLMMCLGELATAAELGANITVIVFNDAALSLIDIKQQGVDLPTKGVRTSRIDFAGIAQNMGCLGIKVEDAAGLDDALQRASAHRGPSLIDVAVDAEGYFAQFKALRG